MSKLRIGLQTSRLDYGYGVKIWQAAMITAKQMDVDLIIFPGRNLDSPHGWDYQYNSIFQLMNKDTIDAAILITTLVSNYVNETRIENFFREFSDIPMVSVGTKIDNIPSIIINNQSGIRELTRHQIEIHKAERIAFIKGPETNWEANERFKAFKEELETHGIPIDESLIGHGDFTTHHVEPEIEKILSSNTALPDAFMFANDEMAIEGMRILREKGIKIPDDTAIIGYDDIGQAASQSIPITTIAQPLSDIADCAVKTAIDLALGKEVDKLVVLPTKPVIRSSCGCMLHSINNVLHINTNNDLILENNIIADKVINIISTLNYSHNSDQNGIIKEVLNCIIDISKEKDLHTADENAVFDFLNRFTRILRLEAEKGFSPEQWQIPLSILSEIVDSSFETKFFMDRFRFIIRACTVLTLDTALSVHSSHQFEFERTMEKLQDIEYNISSIMEINDLVQTLYRQLPNVGINTFILSKYDNEWTHNHDEEWKNRPQLFTVASMYDCKEYSDFNAGTITDRITPIKRPKESKSRALAVYPLFFRETHYGTITFELSLNGGFIYESITTQISGVLKRIFLYEAKNKAESSLRKALHDLEDFNEQLNQLSITDELTGLFNRRGFMKMAEHSLFLSRQMKHSSLLVFGDLDRLKNINDNYGHDEGDWAIKTTAEIIRNVFRSTDITARLGGDEFTIFAANMKEELVPVFLQKINKLLEEKKKANGKEYVLSISLGHIICPPEGKLGIEDYMQAADKNLYEQKAERHRKTCYE
ncbi:MAG: diguanylate cyclase [Spirochaetes bacterium]|nr:diguanylate cyclase [Spirochaetota bacterium]